MAADDEGKLSLPADIVRQVAQGVIMTELDADGQHRMIEALVQSVLNAPAGTYGPEKDKTQLEKVIEQEVLNRVRDLAQEWLDEEQDYLRQRVREVMRTKLVDQATETIVNYTAGLIEAKLGRGY